jgi:hypothetical protein
MEFGIWVYSSIKALPKPLLHVCVSYSQHHLAGMSTEGHLNPHFGVTGLGIDILSWCIKIQSGSFIGFIIEISKKKITRLEDS